MSKKPHLHVVSNAKTAPTANKPARTLGHHGMNLWKRVTSQYDIVDAGGCELLTQACQALDRAEALRAIINRDGEMVTARNGSLKEHPGMKPELAARAFVVKTLARMGLHLEPQRAGRGRPGGVNCGYTGEDDYA